MLEREAIKVRARHQAGGIDMELLLRVRVGMDEVEALVHVTNAADWNCWVRVDSATSETQALRNTLWRNSEKGR